MGEGKATSLAPLDILPPWRLPLTLLRRPQPPSLSAEEVRSGGGRKSKRRNKKYHIYSAFLLPEKSTPIWKCSQPLHKQDKWPQGQRKIPRLSRLHRSPDRLNRAALQLLFLDPTNSVLSSLKYSLQSCQSFYLVLTP